ncbi:MAG: NAD-dependent succinate-semialdehyde dehydrogenase [Rhodothermales bacterium]
MPLISINPATGAEIERYAPMSSSDIEERIGRAAAAFARHRATSFAERTRKMNRAAGILEERAGEWGRLMTQEMGKPITQAVAEARKCAWVCRYYAEHAAAFLQDEIVGTDSAKSYVAYQPLGPVLAVMPWNFPFWQVWRFAAPGLMAGNVGLLKHASNVTGCALAIEQILREAGFDDDEFQTLPVSSSAVAGILEDPRIKAATLTGSEGAGRAVGGGAGTQLKPSVLELGGSDPFIVLADADLDRAAAVGVAARMQNNGQSCIAAKRFIIDEPVAEAFIDRFVERVEALTVGDPMDEATDLGPLARADLRDEVHDQVERALAGGATLRTGGHRLDGPGFYYAPTVLTDVAPGTVAFEEEIFGPVASMIVARDADHAVELANRSPFGLGGAVFTEDTSKGEQIALRLDVGCAFVNGMVKSDPRLPFGGIKESGYGRELSRVGIRAFVNVKTVWIG